MLSDKEAWHARRAAEDEAREKQTEALASLGFGPAFVVGGGTFIGGTYFATCQTCGAACQIIGDPDARQPVAIHSEWHDGGKAR